MFVPENNGEGGSEQVRFRPQKSLGVPVEQFLVMFRFDRRDKLAELPIDLNRSGRDDCI